MIVGDPKSGKDAHNNEHGEVLFRTSPNWVFLLAMIAGCACFVAGGIWLLDREDYVASLRKGFVVGCLNIGLFGFGILVFLLELIHPVARLTATSAGLTVRRGPTIRSYGPIQWYEILGFRITGGQQHSVLHIALKTPERVTKRLGRLPTLFGTVRLKSLVPLSINMVMERPEHVLTELERIYRQHR